MKREYMYDHPEDGIATGVEAKRLKTTMVEMADELLCPLTMELPVDVYDRCQIEECIRHQGSDLKSPVTNHFMGPQLLPALQARNTIERLVRSGAVAADRSDHWRRRMTDEEEAVTVHRRAEAGDAAAMRTLAALYHHGDRGVPRDEMESFRWFGRAADAGDACAMVMLGLFYIEGECVEKSAVQGVSLVSAAAGMGSDFAAYYMSQWYAHGSKGLPKDSAKAKYWLRKVLDGSCPIQDLTEESRLEAAAHLQELQEEMEVDDN